jgi:NADH-quinone oxidoreductase subunit N
VIPTPHLVFGPVLPEIILAAVAMIGLLYEALARRSDRSVHLVIGLVGLGMAAIATLALWNWTGPAQVMGASATSGMISADRFAVLGRCVLIVIAAFGLLYGTHYFARSDDEPRGEFYPLVLFATAGMTMIVAAADLIVTFPRWRSCRSRSTC